MVAAKVGLGVALGAALGFGYHLLMKSIGSQ